MTKTKRENKSEQEFREGKDINDKKRKAFLKALESKLLDLGQNILKTGITSLAVSQIDKTEEKIKEELDKKLKKYQNQIFKTLTLVTGLAFLFYGLISLVLFKFDIVEYTNIIFGGLFLIAYFIFKSKR
jgi:hypothetical protein